MAVGRKGAVTARANAHVLSSMSKQDTWYLNTLTADGQLSTVKKAARRGSEKEPETGWYVQAVGTHFGVVTVPFV